VKRIEYFVQFLRREGVSRTLWFVYRAGWGQILRRRFRRCGTLLPKGKLRIEGAGHISIGSLFCGDNILLSAVTRYRGARFEPILTIGHNVRMTDDVRIQCTHRVSIGDNVLFGSNILVTDHDHGVYAGEAPHSQPDEPPERRSITSDGTILIEDNVHIGSYVTVTKNVTIGRGAVIAAHSAVSRNIPAYTLAAGTPARPVKRFNFSLSRWERI
jgi:acetyltransferase-like isoleucine patch superfamily enzyme